MDTNYLYNLFKKRGGGPNQFAKECVVVTECQFLWQHAACPACLPGVTEFAKFLKLWLALHCLLVRPRGLLPATYRSAATRSAGRRVDGIK